MIIEVIDPGLNPAVFLVALAALALGVGLITWGFHTENDELWPWLLSPGAIIVIAVIVSTFPVAYGVYSSALEGAQTEALEEAGFSNVSIEYDGHFNAEAEDGSYFEGQLIHRDGNNWQIIEYVEVEE